MPGVVDRVATAERTAMLGDDPPVLADDDAVGIGMDLGRPTALAANASVGTLSNRCRGQSSMETGDQTVL
jgi:hypothetical protein